MSQPSFSGCCLWSSVIIPAKNTTCCSFVFLFQVACWLQVCCHKCGQCGSQRQKMRLKCKVFILEKVVNLWLLFQTHFRQTLFSVMSLRLWAVFCKIMQMNLLYQSILKFDMFRFYSGTSCSSRSSRPLGVRHQPASCLLHLLVCIGNWTTHCQWLRWEVWLTFSSVGGDNFKK